MLVWAVAGVVIIAGLVLSFRIMRRGLTTFSQDRSKYLDQIEAQQKQIEEDEKNMARSEHLDILLAGLRDLLALAGDPPGFAISHSGQLIRLATPLGEYLVELQAREQTLHGSSKVLHGPCRWKLDGPALHEEYDELAGLMNAVSQLVGHGANAQARPALPEVDPQPYYFARRFVRRKQPGAPVPVAGKRRNSQAAMPPSGSSRWQEMEQSKADGQRQQS